LLKLGPEILRDPGKASQREWLLTDGLGGYASSTVVGLNTRRYHGLLVVATHPPVGRMVLLSKVEESLVVGGQRWELGTNKYSDTLYPRGLELTSAFILDPLPSLTFEVPGGTLTKTVARIHGHPATAIVYRYEGNEAAVLELRPLVAYRDHHALQHENGALNGSVERVAEEIVVRPYQGCPRLRLLMPKAEWQSEGHWYRRLEYEREKERGLDFSEDLFGYGVLSRALKPGDTAGVLAWAGELPPPDRDPQALLATEQRRLRKLAGSDAFIGELRRAADAFLVRRGDRGRSVIAGYHWFADWGRDTMISLPGLCLSTGRRDAAEAILGEFAMHVSEGMIPNRFPEENAKPEYNTVDASLWMIIAIQRYLGTRGDRGLLASRLNRAVTSILEKYCSGTRHGISMTGEALITQGEPGVQLTWMDAKVGDWVVTPRTGQAVEIQALWYNALLAGAELAARAGDSPQAARWTQIASRARDSFRRAFWSEELGYLADVVQGDKRDLSLRPNQLYAIGLEHALVPRDQAVRVLSAVKSALLTPVGLRTLAPSDPAYRGRYEGDPRSRDAAYHQGTVWPYLVGVYFDALIRVHGEAGKREAHEWLRGFAPHLQEAGLGFIGEVFDGDPPHRPGGAVAQAWSVAEILRIAQRLGGQSPVRSLPK